MQPEDHQNHRPGRVRPQPALLTGTSAEYTGARPLPRVVRERPVLFVLGSRGVGKSTVAQELLESPVTLTCPEVQDAVLKRVREGRWPAELLDAPGLVLDGPVWLQQRPAVVDLLTSLLLERAVAGHRTVVCQADATASVHVLLERISVGLCATIALRFPRSRRARLRAAERLCREHGIPPRCARGTTSSPTWSYREVLAQLRAPFFQV